VFLQRDPSKDDWIDALNRAGTKVTARVVGSGVLSQSKVLISRGRTVEEGGALAFLFDARLQSRTFSTSACRLISPLAEVTRVRQGAVFELDGAPALDRLSEHASSITDGSPVLIAIAGPDDALSPGGRTLALRGIEGVDPTQGSLLIGEGIESGARIAFAVRDAHAARRDLENHLRALSRSGAGAAPVFGLYTCSAGRGQSLYGGANVESRLIRSAFPQMPLLGLKSSYEVAPIGGVLMSQVLSGVFTCFSQPS
jgi:small ligand-binding sensory domain FIST